MGEPGQRTHTLVDIRCDEVIVPLVAANYRDGLLMAEGDHGIDLHGAACRDESCEGGYGDECECDGGEGDGVVRGDAEKHVSDQVRGDECAGDSDEETCGCEEQSFAQDHAKNRATRSTESDADADLVGAAGNGIGDHAEDSGGGGDQCHDGEKSEQKSTKALLRDGSVEEVGQLSDIGDGQVFVNFLYFLADGGGYHGCAQGAFHH